MRYLLGLLLFLLSVAAFLFFFFASEFAQHASDKLVLKGLAFAWCGPFTVLSIVVMHSTVGGPGRTAYLIYMVMVLACMIGINPTKPHSPIIENSDFVAARVIGGLVLVALMFGFFCAGKSKLPQPAVGKNTPDIPDV